ncbi:MAG: hypothetical protein OER95_02035 [Acidimicrobiia bacterium]|nr:hypothetical protein [Acidimicrobiia bacterium]
MMTHPTNPAPGTNRPATARRGPRRRLLVTGVILVALVATGCTGGPGTEDEFVDVLMLNDNFNEAQASCIAEAVFDEYGQDGDALQKISAAESYEFLTGEDGVEGFDQFFTDVVSDCVSVGPSPDDT